MKKEYVTPCSLVVEQCVEFYLLAYSHVKILKELRKKMSMTTSKLINSILKQNK